MGIYLLAFMIVALAVAGFFAGNVAKQKKHARDDERRRRLLENLRVALSE
jgi:hypothetical protein